MYVISDTKLGTYLNKLSGVKIKTYTSQKAQNLILKFINKKMKAKKASCVYSTDQSTSFVVNNNKNKLRHGIDIRLNKIIVYSTNISKLESKLNLE